MWEGGRYLIKTCWLVTDYWYKAPSTKSQEGAEVSTEPGFRERVSHFADAVPRAQPFTLLSHGLLGSFRGPTGHRRGTRAMWRQRRAQGYRAESFGWAGKGPASHSSRASVPCRAFNWCSKHFLQVCPVRASQSRMWVSVNVPARTHTPSKLSDQPSSFPWLAPACASPTR